MLELSRRRRSLVQPLKYAACCASTVGITQVQHKGTLLLFTCITSSPSNCTGTSKNCPEACPNHKEEEEKEEEEEKGGQRDSRARWQRSKQEKHKAPAFKNRTRKNSSFHWSTSEISFPLGCSSQGNSHIMLKNCSTRADTIQWFQGFSDEKHFNEVHSRSSFLYRNTSLPGWTTPNPLCWTFKYLWNCLMIPLMFRNFL